MPRFWIEFRGPARLWAASIVFTILGAGLAFALPQLAPSIEQDPVLPMVTGILGWTFFVLGLVVLVPLVAALYICRSHPGKEAVWYWWINYIGGLLGAMVFAIPATLAFPVVAIAYLMRPNAFFPVDSESVVESLMFAALFTVVGIAVLIFTIFLAQEQLRQDRKRGF